MNNKFRNIFFLISMANWQLKRVCKEMSRWKIFTKWRPLEVNHLQKQNKKRVYDSLDEPYSNSGKNYIEIIKTTIYINLENHLVERLFHLLISII